MDLQGVEEAMEAEAELDVNVPTPESDMATAVSSPTPTPITIYSVVVNSPPIPSIPTPTPTTITNCNAIFPNPAILLNAKSQGPHPSSTAQARALVQSTLSELSTISSRMLSHIPPFKVHLDPADINFLKKESEECKARQKNAIVSEWQTEPYVKIVAPLEQAVDEGTATARSKAPASAATGRPRTANAR